MAYTGRPSSTIDMSKVAKERPMSAECIDYLDDSSRRIKKGFGGFPRDGAGLLNGSRWHGRQQPSKARVPTCPVDGKEATSARTGMANRKYAETDVLMVRPSTAPTDSMRLTKRMVMTEHGSFDSSLGGAAVHVLREPVSPRPSRGKGDSSPDMTVRRTRRHVVPSITREHSADVASTGLRSYVPVTIPGSAGTFLAHHAFKVPNMTTCKLETARAPNPVCEKIESGAARDMYFSRFDSYCFNKTKAIYGGRLRLS